MMGDILCPEQCRCRYQTSGKLFHSGKVTEATKALWSFPTRKTTFATSHVQFQGKTLPGIHALSASDIQKDNPLVWVHKKLSCGLFFVYECMPISHKIAAPTLQTPCAAKGWGGGFTNGLPHCIEVFFARKLSALGSPTAHISSGRSQHSSSSFSYMLSQGILNKARIQPFIWRWFA